MAAKHVFLEILLHLSISLAFFLCESGFFIEAAAFQIFTFSITFQIIVDHAVHKEIGRYREKECPLVIDDSSFFAFEYYICRDKINVGKWCSFQILRQLCISEYFHEFLCLPEIFLLMDLFHFIYIGKKQFLCLVVFSFFQKSIQLFFQSHACKIFKFCGFWLCLAAIYPDSCSCIKSAKLSADFLQTIYMAFCLFCFRNFLYDTAAVSCVIDLCADVKFPVPLIGKLGIDGFHLRLFLTDHKQERIGKFLIQIIVKKCIIYR